MHGRQSCVRLPSFAFAQRLQLLAAQACMMLPSKSSKGSQRGHGAAGHGCRHCGAAEECHHAVPVCCSSAAVAHQVHSVALPMHTATGLAWPQCPSVIAGSHARARRDHAIHASTLNDRSEIGTSHLLRRRGPPCCASPPGSATPPSSVPCCGTHARNATKWCLSAGDCSV